MGKDMRFIGKWENKGMMQNDRKAGKAVQFQAFVKTVGR